LCNANTTDVVCNATDTYLTGSELPFSGNNKIGTYMRWFLKASKTASGTGVPTFNIRFGTGATVTDTARCTWTGATQTSAADDAWFSVIGVIRATGATTVCAGAYEMLHRNGVSGFKNDEGGDVKSATSTAFTSTPAGTQVGLSVNPSTAAVWTFQVISAELTNRP
jgi:hypothetical protein